MTQLQAAEAFRKALQMFAASLADDKAMEVAAVFDPWAPGRTYAVGDLVTYGVNSVGDPQLYRVAQTHTSQADWTPDAAPALLAAVGLNNTGYPVWAQPTGAYDAYDTGDIVDWGGILHQSTMDGNVYSPEAYPAGWQIYTE